MEIIKFEEQKDINEFFEVALSRRNLIPIIGSGFTKGEQSQYGKVPDGKLLQEIMIQKICEKSSDIKEQDFEEQGYKFSDVADEFFKKVSPKDYKAILRKLFLNVTLDSTKKQFLKINWPYLYTLNIDDAIENHSKFEPVLPYKKLSDQLNDLNCVFKMHGDVKEELKYDQLPNVIFSKEQYIKSLESNSDILNYFQSDYSSKNIIFIGCSLEDELDLKYAISTTTNINNPRLTRLYITSNEPKGLRRSRLEDFGITKILLIDDYTYFYKYLFSIYDNLRFFGEKPFEQFKNPIITVCEKELSDNKDFLLDVVGRKSSECSLPYFVGERSIYQEIVRKIPDEVVTVISGKRFSGKSFLSKILLALLQDKDVYLFPSNISFNNDQIKDLIKLQNAYLIFDTNCLDAHNVSILGSLLDELKDKKLKAIIINNKSDNLVNNAASMLTNNNYFLLNDKLTNTEISHINDRLSEIGLIKIQPDKSLLDNCFRAFEAYKASLPIRSGSLSEKEFILTVLLSTDGKVYSIIFNIFSILKSEVDEYVSKLSPFIEYGNTGSVELHHHSGYKIICNSSSWLFKILNEYKETHGHKKVAEIICKIVEKLLEKKNFQYLYKKVITFDNLNQIFSGKSKGEAGLILNIYEKLERILYNDDHFWLQRAKSILYLKWSDMESLRLAKDYAKKAYFDSTNDKFKTYATTTIALIHGRIAAISNFSNRIDLIDAIYWYHSGLQENQYNKRYVDEILRKTKKKGSDITGLCNYILQNNLELESNEKKNAEFIIKKVFDSNRYSSKMRN
ncbi:SIR2 family protein [uncultured Desulfobacter sp.]|uniref:SIR2 family protein n=1 Tax=uncultured Desulfobacter sp. TaxID=240139 RepID=UPI002AA65AFA|nr:SIR2 family protein [uncultured Desulfobacter sp.]